MSINWQLVESEYVRGYVDADFVHHHYSERELARRYGCHHKTIANRRQAGDWKAKREVYSRQLAAQVAENAEVFQVATILSAREAIREVITLCQGIRRRYTEMANKATITPGDAIRAGRTEIEMIERLEAMAPEQVAVEEYDDEEELYRKANEFLRDHEGGRGIEEVEEVI
mgnify:CR=1 FL=1|jgi:hypothetical protein